MTRLSRKLWDHDNSNLQGIHIRIATYNLQDLFLDGPDEKPHAAKRAIRRLIHLVDADVLAVQEVGSVEALQDLNAGLARPYAYIGLLPGNSNRSIHLGVLSRYELKLTSHVNVPLYEGDGKRLRGFVMEEDALTGTKRDIRLQRDILLAEFCVGGLNFGCFIVHLKSKWSPAWADLGTDQLRAAEARCLSRLVTEYCDEHVDDEVIVLGDFNDVPTSDAMAPLRALHFTDPHRHLKRSMGRNPTTYWPRRRKRIDRIYLRGKTAERVQEGSQTIHAGEMAKQASDHYPVSVMLNT